MSCWTFGTPRAIDLSEASGQPYKPVPALKKERSTLKDGFCIHYDDSRYKLKYTAISRKVVRKNVQATTLKSNMGYA